MSFDVHCFAVFFFPISCFFDGFVDAVCGGGGLILLPAVLILGVPPASALGTNKAVGIWGSLASSGRYWRAGKLSRGYFYMPHLQEGLL